jgi:hypothetical protein
VEISASGDRNGGGSGSATCGRYDLFAQPAPKFVAGVERAGTGASLNGFDCQRGLLGRGFFLREEILSDAHAMEPAGASPGRDAVSVCNRLTANFVSLLLRFPRHEVVLDGLNLRELWDHLNDRDLAKVWELSKNIHQQRWTCCHSRRH